MSTPVSTDIERARDPRLAQRDAKLRAEARTAPGLPERVSAGRGLLQINTVGEAMELARSVANTSMVPQHFRGKPEEIFAVILTGAELGIGPMQALHSWAVINGRAEPSAQLVQALVRRAGHALDIVDADHEHATIAARRQGWAEARTLTVTIQQAAIAGWTRNPVYKSDPEAMLVARATTRAGKRWFADVLKGLIGDDDGPDTSTAAPTVMPNVGLLERIEAKAAALPPAPAVEEPPVLNVIIPRTLPADPPQEIDEPVAPLDVPEALGDACRALGVPLKRVVGEFARNAIRSWADLDAADPHVKAAAWAWALAEFGADDEAGDQ